MIRYLIILFFLVTIPSGIYGFYYYQNRGAERPVLDAKDLVTKLGITETTLLTVIRDLDEGLVDTRGSSQALEMIKALAPQITLHPEETYLPSDPMPFVESAELRSSSISPDPIPFVVSDLKKGFPLFEIRPSRIDRGSLEAPAFWRLSHSPVLIDLQPTIVNTNVLAAVRVMIEYWFHYDYNDAHVGGLFNHEGDWESASVVVEISVNRDLSWKYQPLALFLSQHEYGEWLCWDSKTPRPELYSALGTHATYRNNGLNPEPFYIDRTGSGSIWQTSEHLRPLVLEPYYGYEGLWGSNHWFEYNKGPLAPGPRRKTLPKRRPKWEGKALARLRQQCSL